MLTSAKWPTLWFLFSFGFFPAIAQDHFADSTENLMLRTDEELLAELLGSDTTDILSLLDSLFAIRYKRSLFSVGTGYISRITNAGRNFGIQQYGFHFNAAYYHRSGFYGNIAGYWNSDLEPKYNPTVTGIGYMQSLGKRWTLDAGYDHFFYSSDGGTDEEPGLFFPLTNAFNGAVYYNLKWVSIGSEYSFLFGSETAHRLRWSVMSDINIRTGFFIERIKIMPGAAILLGNANIYYLNPTLPYSQAEVFRYVHRKLAEEVGPVRLRLIRQNNREYYNELMSDAYDRYRDDLQVYDIQQDKAFGAMNYSVFLPVYAYIGNFSVNFQYQYNIPVALPGENIILEPNSFFGIGLSYFLGFRKKRE